MREGTAKEYEQGRRGGGRFRWVALKETTTQERRGRRGGSNTRGGGGGGGGDKERAAPTRRTGFEREQQNSSCPHFPMQGLTTTSRTPSLGQTTVSGGRSAPAKNFTREAAVILEWGCGFPRTFFSCELELCVLFPLSPLHLDEVIPLQHPLYLAVRLACEQASTASTGRRMGEAPGLLAPYCSKTEQFFCTHARYYQHLVAPVVFLPR